MQSNEDSFLKIDHLNHLIKTFSFALQTRIDELDDNHHSRPDRDETEAFILARYSGYKIENIKQVKYAQKFCQRVLEVFSYFRMQSKNAMVLEQIEEKMIKELDAILIKHPIAVDELLTYVVGVVSKPFNKQTTNMLLMGRKSMMEPFKIKITSASNLRRKQKKLINRKIEINQNELHRLYSYLQLDRMYMQRCAQSLNSLQQEGVDRIVKDLIKKNQKINVAITNYSRSFTEEKVSNKKDISGTISIDNMVLSVNQDCDNRIKKVLSIKSPVNEVKWQSNEVTMVNNWLRKEQRKRTQDKPIQIQCLLENNTYNFCIKQSAKFQQRKLRRFQQNQEPSLTSKQYKNHHQSFTSKRRRYVVSDDWVRVI